MMVLRTDGRAGGIEMSRLNWRDVETITFEPTTFREGYAVEEVDGFLDRVCAGMRAGEDVSALLGTAVFTVTKLSPGYDMSEVDALLGDLATWTPGGDQGARRAAHRRVDGALLPPPRSPEDDTLHTEDTLHTKDTVHTEDTLHTADSVHAEDTLHSEDTLHAEGIRSGAPPVAGVVVVDHPSDPVVQVPARRAPASSDRLGGMTADEVDRVLFTPVRFKPGYSIADVDELLGEITVLMRRHQDPRPLLRQPQLRRVRFAEGFPRGEVDRLLDRLRIDAAGVARPQAG